MVPAWSGYSVAHWQSDALVTESRGFRDDSWLEIMENPLTNAARVVERIWRPNFGALEIEVTIDDPKAYTKPLTVTMHQKIVLDTETIDLMCLENNKDLGHMKP